ncbi:uncharacterized protein LOC126689305 isoform X1 [Quercus robur]|uniref:uncharacterized protein LOC126689305 isoform X1 n=1 Tax=Quercus robur TaxID=38942 RepID=UPI002162AD8B|nr:uncharacterized protein LOC126689305 isoform X1 [Quercus robur]
MNLSLSSSTSLSTSSTTSSSSSSSSSTSWFSGIVRGRSGSAKMSSNSSAAAGFGDSVSPIVKKNHWRGVLFKYGPKPIQDAMELDQQISHLINKEDSEGVVLLGHSTGCQDIVQYMRTNAACYMLQSSPCCHFAGTHLSIPCSAPCNVKASKIYIFIPKCKPLVVLLDVRMSFCSEWHGF